MNYSLIYHPTEVPFKGLYSQPSPVSLGAGMYQTVKNWRLDGNVLRVRYPMTQPGTDTGPAALTNGAWVGAWAGYLNGTHYRIAAWYSTSTGFVHIYKYDSSGAQAEITSSSGKYGDTRLDGTFRMVSFAPVKDTRTGKEYLIIQDGKSDPRVYDPLVGIVSVNAAITNPTVTPKLNCLVTFPKKFSVKDAANTSYSNSHATRFSAADPGASSTENYVTFDIQTGATSGDTSTQTLGTAVDFSDCPYLCMLVKTSYTAFLENVKLETVDATGNETIHDPKSTTPQLYKPYIAIPIDTDYWLYVFSISHVASTKRDTVTGIKWTFTGTAPSANQNVRIYGVFGSGKVAGQASHVYSFINQGSRAESPPTYLDILNYSGEYFRNLGCATSLNFRLPNDPRVFYQYNLNFINITTAQLNAGVDGMAIYRSDYGEDASIKTYVKTSTIGTYSGSWSFGSDDAGTTLATGGLHVFYDNTPIESKDPMLAPDAGCLTIPKGIWMESTPERLYVLSYDTTGSYSAPAYSALWASDVYSFSRFYRFHISEDSGTKRDIPGETGICLKAAPTSTAGVYAMLVWTNKGFYQFDATSATAIQKWDRLSSYGTWCPYSVAISHSEAFWVDQEKRVRRYNGRVEDISSLSIQDKLDAVGTSWDYAGQSNGKLFFGGFWKEKYYLSCDQSGTISWTTGSESPLIFDTRYNTWLEDSLGSASYSTRFWLPSDSRMDTFSKDGFKYRYEDPSSGQYTDGYQYATGGVPVAGSGYTATLHTGAFFPGMKGDGAGILGVYTDVMCDDFDSGTMAVTYNYLPSGGAPTQTVSIDGTASVKWARASAVPSGNTQGGLSVSVQVVFSSGCATKRLYGLRLAWEPRDVRPGV